MKLKASAIAVVLLVGLPAFAESGTRAAEQFFAHYQKLARDFDPAAADLYCDTATVRNIRVLPDGQKKTLELPAPRYKELVRAAMPLAQARGDTNIYTDIAYAAEGNGVRITATRYSNLKQYSSPISLLIGPCNGSGLAILEELSESRP